MSGRFRTALLVAIGIPGGCAGDHPSDRMDQRVALPQPGIWLPTPDEPAVAGRPAAYEISARSLIPITFHEHPEVRSSYQSLQAERARYDFFIASNDALTLGMRSSVSYRSDRQRLPDPVGRVRDRTRDGEIVGTVDKQFFDTTRLDARGGFRRSEFNDDTGYHPFVAADLRYPLGPSREKLERTSEDIFRQNELIDAQLAYINVVRERLERALRQYFEVIEQRRRVEIAEAWLDDLTRLTAIMDAMPDRDLRADRARVEAEVPRVTAQQRAAGGRYEVELARLKSSTGLDYEVELRVSEEAFQPFEGATHEELRRRAVEYDPEIATLKNSLTNAQVQLDLARRGKWDIALLLGTFIDLEGRGNRGDQSAYGVNVGLEVSRVDARVTDSLERQALASIARFEKAVRAREREIYVDTLEPMIRIETLGQNRRELRENLARFREDYERGVAAYRAGELNIDDLLKRRETLAEQEIQIAELGNFIGVNIAELMTATGKYFEILEDQPLSGP